MKKTIRLTLKLIFPCLTILTAEINSEHIFTPNNSLQNLTRLYSRYEAIIQDIITHPDKLNLILIAKENVQQSYLTVLISNAWVSLFLLHGGAVMSFPLFEEQLDSVSDFVKELKSEFDGNRIMNS